MKAANKQFTYSRILHDLFTAYFVEQGRFTEIPALTERALDMVRETPIYRIEINPNNSVKTDCYDLLEKFAPKLKMTYDNVDNLPKWVQDKIAVLMLLDHTQQNAEVDEIGRRISKNIFWVYDSDGRDAGTEG